MSFKSFFKFAVLAGHILASVASPLESRASDDLVQTPAGLYPKSNVHPVPEGSRVHQTPTEVQVISANGTVLHSAPFTAASKKVAGPARRDLPQGWIAAASWYNSGASPIAFFGTNWNVPPTPSSWDGQLLYWFNGLEPSEQNAILQPVLQYGVSPAGGGEYYSVASWWLIADNVYYTPLTQVSPGTFLQGQMKLVSTSTSGGVTTYDYTSTFAGIPASLITASTTSPLAWAYETLEIYTTASTADLPSGNTVYSGINISFQNGQHPPSIPWGASSDSADGITMQILDTSSTGGAVLLTY